MQQKMDIMSGLKYSITQDEISRRHCAVRAYMRQNNIDIVLILSSYKDGYRRWFTGEEGSERRSESYLLIPIEGDVLHVIGDHFVTEDLAQGQPVGAMPDPEESFTGIRTQYYFSAFELNRFVKMHHRIGIVHKNDMKLSMQRYLEKYLDEVCWVEMDSVLTRLIAEKSEEEINLMQKSVHLQEKVFDGICAYMKPGLLEADIVRYVRFMANHLGSGSVDSIESAQVELYSWKEEQDFSPLEYPGRTLQEGDLVQLKLRILGDSGYFSTFTRLLSIGKPKQEIVKQWTEITSVQKCIQKKMAAGKPFRELIREVQEELNASGLVIENGEFIHGIGYTPYEYPRSDREKQDIILKEGMVIAAEPKIRAGGNVYCCGDQYLITKNGAARMTTVSHEIKVV